MRNRTQGMTEFIVLIGLMVIAAILIAAVFGSNQKGLFQASKETLQDGREIAELSESAASDATKDSGAHSTGNLAGGGSEKEDAQLRSSAGGKAQSEKFVPPGPESKKYSQAVGDDPRKSRSSTGGFYAPESSSSSGSNNSNSSNNSRSQTGGFNASENNTSGSTSKNSGGNNSASGGFSGNDANNTNASRNSQETSKNSGNNNSESSKSGGFQGKETSKNAENQSNTSQNTAASGSGNTSASGSSGGSESGSQNGSSGGNKDGSSGGNTSDSKKSKPIEPDEHDRAGWNRVDLEKDPLYWKRLRDVRSLEHANVYTNKNPNSSEVKEKFEALLEAYNHPKFFPARARYESWLRKGGRESEEYKEHNIWYYLKMQEIMAGYEGRRSF